MLFLAIIATTYPCVLFLSFSLSFFLFLSCHPHMLIMPTSTVQFETFCRKPVNKLGAGGGGGRETCENQKNKERIHLAGKEGGSRSQKWHLAWEHQ